MPNRLAALLQAADEKTSQLSLKLWRESPALIIYFFHGVCANPRMDSKVSLDPTDLRTIAYLRVFVEYYLQQGYTFVSPDDIVHGLDTRQHSVMATFDDGYANNQLVVPLLHEYKIPAVFFVTTGNVQQEHAFWWDVVYRERAKRGASPESILQEQAALKARHYREIEQHLLELFGNGAMKPWGDADRPLTPAELKSFAQDPWVHIGNHTRDHAILPNYSEEEIQTQVEGCQRDLLQMTGKAPLMIAYPNGNYDSVTIRAAQKIGLRLGVTVQSKKNSLPLAAQTERSMHLSRFYPSQHNPLKKFELARSDVQWYPRVRRLFKKGDFY